MEAVDDSIFGFERASRLVSMVDTYRGYFTVEELNCSGDESPHFWDTDAASCRMQGEMDTASADSAIQYEKGTGLFLGIKSERKVLGQATGAMQYLVSYEYSCSVSYYRKKQPADANFVFAISSEDDIRFIKLGKHREEILSRKDLKLDTLRNNLEHLVGPRQAEPGCSLTLDVTSKQLSP